MNNGYWSNVLEKRLSRRRALAATGGTALGAAFLAACGGGESGSTGGSSSGLLGNETDTTNEAKSGGTLVDSFRKEVTHLDSGTVNSTATHGQILYNYSAMVKAGLSTTSVRPGNADVVGDGMDKWEWSPDLTQITFKVRPNHKFDPRPPTNGRAMTSEDVRVSWERYVKLGASAGDLSNERSEVGPVTSVTTPDASTVVMKLKFPFSILLEVLSVSKNFYVLPALDNFDFKTDMRGSGPFFLEQYLTSQGFTWKKNPDWYEKGQPFLDKIERHLISDYAAELSQFEAGTLWHMEVNPSDVLDVKSRHADMVMLKAPGLDTSAGVLSFSQKADSAFKDERVRRALSMTLDRDLLVSVFFELEKYKAAGIDLDPFWNSHINAAHPEWIDPKGTGLGEGAKYFKHDLAEAKKLIEAAGLKTPVASDYSYFTDRPTPDVKQNEVMMGMMNESKLFTMRPDTLLYDSSWRAAEESKGHGYNGILWNVSSSTSADSNLVQIYTPGGRGAIRDTPIPKVQDLILKQRAEGDKAKRTEIIKQIQQEMALQWPAIMIAGQAPMLTLRWPWLRNHGVFNEGDPTAKQITRWWYDPTKRKA